MENKTPPEINDFLNVDPASVPNELISNFAAVQARCARVEVRLAKVKEAIGELMRASGNSDLETLLSQEEASRLLVLSVVNLSAATSRLDGLSCMLRRHLGYEIDKSRAAT